MINLKSILYFFLITGFAFGATTVNFSSLPDKSWLKVDVEPGHVYGWSEVSWAYDHFHKKFVRIGGCTGGYTNEVYAYWFDAGGNFVSDQILPPGTQGGSNRPGAGCSRGICYDSKRHLVWGYGGIGAPPITCSGTNWALMGLDLGDNSWQKAPNSDSYRMGECCQIEYSEYHDAIILVGQDGGAWHQCWLYEFSKSAWRQLGQEWDPKRTDHDKSGIALTYVDVCYDPDNHVFIMFPGPSDDPETWVFDPETMAFWERRKPNPSPPFRRRYGIAYDQLSHKVIMHGGDTSYWESPYDTWVYDAAANTWTEFPDLGTSRAGAQSRNRAYDYDSEHNAMVLMCPQEWCIYVYRFSSSVSGDYYPALAGLKGIALRTWPNPAREKLYVFAKLTVPGQGPLPYLGIYGINGQLVEHIRWNDTGNSLSAVWNIPSSASGHYFIKMQSAGEKRIERISILK